MPSKLRPCAGSRTRLPAVALTSALACLSSGPSPAIAAPSAASTSAAARLIGFPTDPLEIARHCLTVSATAYAAGGHFKNSTRAAPMASAGDALRMNVVVNGGLPRAEIERWNNDAGLVQERVKAMIERIGQPERGQYHSDRVFDELDQQVAECRAWLANRPPMLAALPGETGAALDHCVVVAATARQLMQVKGTGRAGAMRVAGNAREMLQELRVSGRLAKGNIEARLAAPAGDLYLAGIDVALGLKIVKPDTDFDARSVQVIDDRLRQCHRTFGLQMPLQ
jgi:hypothetical protein